MTPQRQSATAGSSARGALAGSLDRLGTETAFTVLARANELERAGRSVIHLEIGEPDFDTPAHIRDAAWEALQQGQTHYCPAAGIPALRDAATAYFEGTREIEVSPGRVLVGTGAKPFLFFTILALTNPGDEIIYPDPGFPIYESAIRFAGRDAGAARAARGARFRLRPRRVRGCPRAAHEARDPQLAAQPDRRRAVGGRHRGARPR